MSKNRVIIPPPIIWQHSETMLAESKIPNDTRFSKVTVDMSVDDILRLFLATVEDSLEYEINTLIKNNTKLSGKEVVERTIIDDRLTRMVELLTTFGVNNTAIYCHINMIRDQYFHRLQEINEKLEEANEALELTEDKQKLFKHLNDEDDEVSEL